MIEQTTEMHKAVLNNLKLLLILFVYSAVYLTIPLLIAPFPKAITIAIKFIKAPISATPEGPTIEATTFVDIKPAKVLRRVITPE